MRVRIFHTDDLVAAYLTNCPGIGLREVFGSTSPTPLSPASARSIT